MNSDAYKSKVDDELADRLDTLFDDDASAESSLRQKRPTKDPLDELKSLVMSIEWEITDEVMGRFLSQIEVVKSRFAEDRILVMYLQLLGSLGLYVKTNKGKAHPNAFKLLNSVYSGFEKSATPGAISSPERKKLLYIELNKYKELKEQIESARESEPPRVSDTGQGQKSPRTDRDETASPSGRQLRTEWETPVTKRVLDEAVADLKSSILKELAAIRGDIARLVKSK